MESFVLTRSNPLSREELQFLLDGILQNLGPSLLRVLTGATKDGAALDSGAGIEPGSIRGAATTSRSARCRARTS